MTPVPAVLALALHGAFLLLLALVLPRPRAHAYSVLAVLLALGFWGKFFRMAVLGGPPSEPVGAFSGSRDEWSRAVAWAIAAALGTATVRALQIWRARRRLEGARPIPDVAAPEWFRRWRAAVWTATAIVVVACVAWNTRAAVYQIGLDPAVVLPLRGNVVLGWLLVGGFPLWIALLVGWEGEAGVRAFWPPVAEGFLSATSALSRSMFLLRLLPYALVYADVRAWTSRASRSAALRIGAVAALAFAVSIGVVSLSRLEVYPRTRGEVPPRTAAAPEPAPPAVAPAPVAPDPTFLSARVKQFPLRPPLGRDRLRDAAPAPDAAVREAQRGHMAREVLGLVTGRWVGLEGTLAVSAYPNRGSSLFRRALSEDPRRGAESIYQKIAGSFYSPQPGVTFLTLPGIVAVLAYTGSTAAVFAGMALATALALATEQFARRAGGAFVGAVTGTLLAYTYSQLNFPYLGAVFLLELWVTLAIFHAIGRRG